MDKKNSGLDEIDKKILEPVIYLMLIGLIYFGLMITSDILRISFEIYTMYVGVPLVVLMIVLFCWYLFRLIKLKIIN